MTVIRSQPEAPGGTRSGCGSPVTRTRSVTRPAAVRTTTWVTGGPIAGLSAKATRIARGTTGRGETDPDPLADRAVPAARLPHGAHVPVDRGVRQRPLAHWLGMVPMSEAEEDAVTFLMPGYCATLRYRFQPGSVKSPVASNVWAGSVAVSVGE